MDDDAPRGAQGRLRNSDRCGKCRVSLAWEKSRDCCCGSGRGDNDGDRAGLRRHARLRWTNYYATLLYDELAM